MLGYVCFSQFVTITSHEQRAQYKEAFNTDYKEYLQMKIKIDQVTQEFTALRDQLTAYPKKSDEYKVCQTVCVLISVAYYKLAYLDTIK